MDKLIFDSYGRRGELMRQYVEKAVEVHLQRHIGDSQEIPGSVILVIVYEVAKEVAETFKVDFEPVFHELTELMDATIWADLPGGANDPARKTDPFGSNLQ